MPDKHAVPGPSDLLTIPEAAAILRLKVSTLRAWRLQRRIPFVKLGRKIFVLSSDVDAFIKKSVVPARPSERPEAA